MKIINKKKLKAYILTAAVIFSLLFAYFFTAARTCHDCTGDGCSVCGLLEICRDSISTIAGGAVVKACVYAAIYALLTGNVIIPLYIKTKSPVILKERLIN